MIRDFEIEDLDKLDANQFSGRGEVSDDVFCENGGYDKYTLEDEGEVITIMCLKEYEPKHIAIFFLMKDGLNFKQVREIKKFMNKLTVELEPKTCITYSVDCDILNRWHDFFGFKKEGDLLVEEKLFNKWVIRWE
jgi:hypothetical protein